MTKSNRLIMFMEINSVYFNSRAKQKALHYDVTQTLEAVVCVHWGVSKIPMAVRVKRVYLPYFFGLNIIEASLLHSDTTLGMTSLDNKQHPQKIDMHAPSEIRTYNSSKRAALGPLLRPRSPWDRPTCTLRVVFITIFDFVRHLLLKTIPFFQMYF
jgi:hypothetical protein